MHSWNAKKYKDNKNIILIKAINKYGFDSIKWDIIYECSNEEEMRLKEIEYINEYNSIDHKYGYNMICGYKDYYEKRNNIDYEYSIDIIKRKLKSNGHDPDKYIELTEELSNNLKNDYLSGEFGIRTLSKKYKITRNRIKRFLLREGIEIKKDIIKKINTFLPEEKLINEIINLYKNNKTIKEISEIKKITTMLVSRILHDHGIRKSKRFKNGKRYDGRQPINRLN